MSFNYSNSWNEYSGEIKKQFNDLWEQIESILNHRYPKLNLSDKLDKFGILLLDNSIAKAILSTTFLWAIRLICEQPYLVDMESYQKNRKKYHYTPSSSQIIPVRLKIWHAYQKLLPEKHSYSMDFKFHIVNRNGSELGVSEFEKKTIPLDDLSDFSYGLRVLYQIRNNITHAHKINPIYRDVYLMNLGNIALFELVMAMNNVQNI